MKVTTTILALLFLSVSSLNAQKVKQTQFLINNVQIFNGKDEKTTVGNVLIIGNLINKISATPIITDKAINTVVIDGKGMFLMPGLIDAHTHIMEESIPFDVAMRSEIQYIDYVAGYAAEKQLLRGFTTIRDVGGPSFGLKRAIDEGIIKGPRIYPSGAAISQTSGHGDFEPMNESPSQMNGPLSFIQRNNFVIVADGVDQVLFRTREQLKLGASQIKIMAGGGVASDFDPLDVKQYTEAEINAAVADWNTYVMVHAYTPNAIKAAINAGVKCIEHGQLADESTAKLMAEKGIWWSLQPFLDDEDAIPFPEGSENRAKQLQMVQGTDNAYKLAKKYNIKTAFGTDCLFDPKLATRQGAQLAKLIKWYTPYEILRMATFTNGELLSLSGPRNPYPNKLGVIKEGAYADLIIVDGNPLKNINLVADPERNFMLIMKDGKYKKTH